MYIYKKKQQNNKSVPKLRPNCKLMAIIDEAMSSINLDINIRRFLNISTILCLFSTLLSHSNTYPFITTYMILYSILFSKSNVNRAFKCFQSFPLRY